MVATIDDLLFPEANGDTGNRDRNLSRNHRDSKGGLSYSLHERGRNGKLFSRSYSEKALLVHSSDGVSGMKRNGDSKGSNHSLYEKGNIRRISISRKSSEKSEQHSSRRRRGSGENSRSSSRRRRTAKSSDRRPSSRQKYSGSRPSRTKSADDTWESTHETDIARRRSTQTNDLQIVGRRISKEKSQRRRSRDSDQNHGRSESMEVINTLYGHHEDARTKMKTAKGTSKRAITPGVEHVGSKSNRRIINTLYGTDSDSKAKTRGSASSERATNPGVVEQVDSSKTNSTLYTSGTDAKAKAKASAKSSEPARTPGVKQVSTSLSSGDIASKQKNTTNTLYGSEADAKAKAKASGGSPLFASSPGADSTIGTLYGNDADAKARLRASRGGAASFSAVPGAESLANPSTAENTDPYRHYGQYETIVQDAIATPVSMEMGHTSDSESDSISEPKRNMDACGRGVSSEEMGHFPLPNDPEMPSTRRNDGTSEKEGADDEQQKSRKKRFVLLFLLFLFLIIAGGVVVWYFLLRNDSDGNEESRIGNTNIQDPTKSPSPPSTGTGFSPTQPPVFGNTTMFPSASPSNRFLYDPPRKSDCQAIAANQTIAGREEMENADFELGVEVVLPENLMLTGSLLQALLFAIQRNVLPSLAGCSVIIDDQLEAWRFVIFDAFVTVRFRVGVPLDESCTDEALMQLNCHRVSVKLDLFLKGNVRFLDILALISDEGENIANHLELDDLFSIIKLTGAESLMPTDVPTRMPSATPSFSPTELPTVLANLNPTGTLSVLPTRKPTGRGIPSMLPTRATTGEPSLSPTMLPSEAPSMAPSTTAPTADRYVQPTGLPTDSPSVRPTIMFSGSPTPPPTPVPSSRPSVAPTESPSLMPSILPSLQPTDSPSLSPSESPTKFPTPAPSSTPSTSPSTPSPTPAPTPPPPTYAASIITQAYGPYTNYPVSQSSTSFKGDARLAIDGNRSGEFVEDRSVTHTLNRPDQWWQVDLATGVGRPIVVKHITIWNRTDCCTDRLAGVVVQLLDANQKDITPSNIDNVLTDARETTIDFGLVPNVSFVKITNTDYALSLAEVEIYGYPPK